MTLEELIEAHLAGELDLSGQAALEEALREQPGTVHEIVEQMRIDLALRVLLDDGSADRNVAASVRQVLEGKSVEAFKTDLIGKLRAEAPARVALLPARRFAWRAAAAVLVVAGGAWLLARAVGGLAGTDEPLADRGSSRERETPKEAAPEKPSSREDQATVVRLQGVVMPLSGREPLSVGRKLGPGEGVATSDWAGSWVQLEFPDGTQISGRGVLRLKAAPGGGKGFLLESGRFAADVTKQSTGRPLVIETAHASATVLGTRFVMSAEKAGTRLLVEEGAVRLTHRAEGRSLEVRSGHQAAVTPGTPFEVQPTPGAARYLDIDLSSGLPTGPGRWTVEGRSVRQAGAADEAPSQILFNAPAEGSVQIEATATVTGTDGRWGFGLVAAFGRAPVVLRSVQGGPGGPVFELADAKAIPFEHGREGAYRLKLRIQRKGDVALLQGRIWQGDREPDGWIIEDELPLQGPLTRVGFQTLRGAASFSRLRVELLREESR